MALIVNNIWILNAIQKEDPSSNKPTMVDRCTVCTHHHPLSWLSSLYLIVFAQFSIHIIILINAFAQAIPQHKLGFSLSQQ